MDIDWTGREKDTIAFGNNQACTDSTNGLWCKPATVGSSHLIGLKLSKCQM